MNVEEDTYSLKSIGQLLTPHVVVGMFALHIIATIHYLRHEPILLPMENLLENCGNPQENPQENHMTFMRQSLHMVLVMIHMFKEVYEECRRIYLKLWERPKKFDLNNIVLCSNY